ncbi:hypothetical protein D3C73_445040 [compost metagenome]
MRCAVRLCPFEDQIQRADAIQGVVESLDFGVRTIAPSITSMVSTSPMLSPKLASKSGGKSMMTSPLPSAGSWHFTVQRWASVMMLITLWSWRERFIMREMSSPDEAWCCLMASSGPSLPVRLTEIGQKEPVGCVQEIRGDSSTLG